MTEEIKQAYVDKMSAQLREVGAKVEVVKARIAKSTAEVRIAYHKQIAEWNDKETLLKTKMEELRQAGSESFESIKWKVQNLWTEVAELSTSIEENKNNEQH